MTDQSQTAPTRRRRCYEVLHERAPDDRLATRINLALIGLISANIVAIVLESVAAIGNRHQPWFRAFEAVSVIVFSIEYGLRLWSVVELHSDRSPLRSRLRYMVTPLALVDLAAILPFYLGFLVPADLRFLRVFRVFLVLKLTRYDGSLRLLATVLRNEARPIAATLLILAVLLIVAASLAYLLENEAQPEVFSSIPHSMYWAIMTMTTVGFGDVVPVTVWGKVLAGLIGIVGLGMVALPAGLLASGFSAALHERRVEFRVAVDRILADGIMTPEEGGQLEQLRRQLDLTDHQAAEMTRLLAHQRRGLICPHCGKPVHPLATAADPASPADD
jgi:voltage-gated potassium channel